MKKKRHHVGLVLWLILFIISVVLNIVAWNSTAFCDWYMTNLFPYLSVPFAWLTSLSSISIGERLLLAVAFWVCVLLLITILWILKFLFTRKHKNDIRYINRRQFTGGFWKLTLWVANVVLLIMTLNCTILYHVTPLENSLAGYGKDYDAKALGELRDMIVDKVNTLSASMPRDSYGNVLYGRYADNADAADRDETVTMAMNSGVPVSVFTRNTETDMEAGAQAAVRKLSANGYPRLQPEGWAALNDFQARPRHLSFSGFVSQQKMMGYYFPFTMEANYNELMENLNKPYTMCHEIAHTHGYIFEDDASFLAWLACIESDDPVFEYSGWLGILNYVNNSFYASVSQEEYDQHPAIADQVWTDQTFVRDDVMARIEAASPLQTETVKQSADNYLDNTLKINGVSSGKAQYDHVTQLILEYYDGNYEK